MKIVFLILLFSNSLFASSNIEALSQKVIELRKEVELLNDDYKTEREKALSDLKALSVQKAELESNIRNEEIREKQFVEKVEKYKKELQQTSVESEEIRPILQKNIIALKEYINSNLPFKRKERLESVEGLESQLEKGEISPIKASNQLWAMIEDEKRLAKETSIHKQTISIDGKMNLADVVKVGMLFLYFKSDDGKVGMAKKEGEDWNFISFSKEEDKRETIAFFESIKKQIRQGYFELPTGI